MIFIQIKFSAKNCARETAGVRVRDSSEERYRKSGRELQARVGKLDQRSRIVAKKSQTGKKRNLGFNHTLLCYSINLLLYHSVTLQLYIQKS